MKKLYQNFLNSINGLKEGFKEQSFLLEILGGLILIPYLIFSNIDIKFKRFILVCIMEMGVKKIFKMIK